MVHHIPAKMNGGQHFIIFGFTSLDPMFAIKRSISSTDSTKQMTVVHQCLRPQEWFGESMGVSEHGVNTVPSDFGFQVGIIMMKQQMGAGVAKCSAKPMMAITWQI